MSSKNASSAGNQQERSIKSEKIKNSVIAVVIAIVGWFVGDFVFTTIVDPIIVPIIGMRSVIAAVTTVAFVIPAWYWVKNKPHI